jgi:hypothetical protein
MKTIKQFLLDNYDNEPGQLQDVRDHGIYSGLVSELIYYTDIDAFYKEYNDDIYIVLNSYCEETGEYNTIGEMLCSNVNFPICNSLDFSRHAVAVAIELVAQQILDEREQESEAA